MSLFSRPRVPTRGPSGLASPRAFARRVAFGGSAAVALSLALAGPALAADTTPPTAPGTLTVTRVVSSDPTITVSWGASTDDIGVTEYDVYSGANLTPIATVAGTITTATLHPSNFTSKSTVSPISVVAVDAAGNASARTTGIVDSCNATTPPNTASASSPTIGALTSTTAAISWSPAALTGCGQVSPNLNLIVADDNTTLDTVSGSATSDVLTGLTPGTQYTVHLQAGGNGSPAPGSSVTFTTAPSSSDTSAPTAPGAPTVVRSAGSGHNEIDVSWGASTDDVGVTGYDVIENGTVLVTAPGTATSAFFLPSPNTPLENQAAVLTVVAHDAAGNSSAPSAPATFDSCHVPGLLPSYTQASAVTLTHVTDSTASIWWTPGAATTKCFVRTPTIYDVWQDNGPSAAPTLLGTTASGILDHTQLTGLAPSTSYKIYIDAPADPAPTSAKANEISFTTAAAPVADTTPPTQPGPLTITRDDTKTPLFTLAWGASTDDVGVAEYDIYSGSDKVATVDGSTTTTKLPIGVLQPNTEISSPQRPVSVVAVDAAGNVSMPSVSSADTCSVAPQPNSANPSAASVSGVTATTAVVSWTPGAIVACGQVEPKSFLVTTVDGTVVATAAEGTTSVELTGLTPSTAYALQVRADASGFPLAGSPATVPAFTTAAATPTTTPFAYGLKGAASLKNLVTGSVPLVGTVSGSVDTTTHALTAGLQLAESTASLKALGFLPVTATVDIVPTGDVTGTVTGSSVSASVKTRIKLPSIKTFGIQLAGGANCQSAQVSTIPLSSVGAFSIASGGTLAGTFAISNLTGCGALNGVVSPLTSGNGNTISLALTPGGPPAK